MRSNIEIKAVARDFERQRRLAEELADGPGDDFRQEDTFFVVPRGRLKLRSFGPERGELIQYERPDLPGPKQSRYRVIATTEPRTLRAALAEALGVLGEVRKRRRVLLAGRTRIHLDEVDGLGRFLELEVVMGEAERTSVGAEIAAEMMARLEIAEGDLVSGAYLDLLMAEGKAGGGAGPLPAGNNGVKPSQSHPKR